ncbi:MULTISPECIES: site-specific integrase [Streptomyces]|uniref:site-specific integrase n=1 Tax=Streptomyces TaxID=1883 RepID=UPI001F5EE8FD|nr:MULTISPECIES: site-specific integrase [Streptomyces]
MLLSLMGLRPAEVCGLRWEDVDLEAETLYIANTRTLMGNKEIIEKGTKSMAGERLLPLPSMVCDALRVLRAIQAADRLAIGEAYVHAGYVFVDELGTTLNGRQLRVRAYLIMDRSDLRRVRLYDARAACLTYLANKDVRDHILAWWAGHTNVKTTKKWYVKPSVEDLRPTPNTLQYRSDGPEDAPVLVLGPTLGTTWHRKYVPPGVVAGDRLQGRTRTGSVIWPNPDEAPVGTGGADGRRGVSPGRAGGGGLRRCRG